MLLSSSYSCLKLFKAPSFSNKRNLAELLCSYVCNYKNKLFDSSIVLISSSYGNSFSLLPPIKEPTILKPQSIYFN